MYPPNYYQQRQLWRQKFPTVVGILLSIFEMILANTIIGCEIVGIFVEFPRMNLFVGYWTYLFFTCAWISLAATSCCCRRRGCGVATLIFQCLAIPMAICVIGFDAYFLNHPTQCFLSDDCYSYSDYLTGSWSYLSSINALVDIKIPVIKGQLAAGVLMLVSCIIYIIIFVITAYRISKNNQIYGNSSLPMIVTGPSIPKNPPSNMIENVHNINGYDRRSSLVSRSMVLPPIVPVEISTNTTLQQNSMLCPYCQSTFPLASEQY